MKIVGEISLSGDAAEVLHGDGTCATVVRAPQLFSVATQAAMLALAAQLGDIALRTDKSNRKYELVGTEPTSLANWLPLVSGDNIITAFDVEITDAAKGFIQKDRGDGTRRRFVTTNGIISTEVV